MAAKDPKTGEGRAARGGSRATATRSPGGASRAGGGPGGRGRTRPVQNVVAKQRPWGLIAGAVAVVVFAAAVLVYAVLKVHSANANKASSPSDIAGLQTFQYAAGQQHVTTPVQYKESPPVGGPHDPYWADCTGTVYSVDIRHENAVHGLEHGAIWITYDPKRVSKDDQAKLAKLVENQTGRMMSPYAGLDSPISIQAWNHQLKVTSATDPRIKEFADFFALNPSFYPEVGASCEQPGFKAHPVVQGQPSQAVGATDAPSGTSGGASSGAAPSGAGSSGAAPTSSAGATSTAP